jgi:CheY-like chemotaxis protein
LGLAISRRLAEMMGGGIHVESEEGKGSHFWFILGFDSATQPILEKDPGAWSLDSDGHEGRILLVEDNAINQEVASKILTKMGYEVRTASSGRDALQALALEKFDAILMDCQMPEMDGYECAGKIREREIGTNRRLPIIALTANALSGDRKRCLEAGMDDYLPKPFQPRVLGKVLDKWIGREMPGASESRGEKEKVADPPQPAIALDAILDKQVVRQLQAMQGDDGDFLSRMTALFYRQTPEGLWSIGEARAARRWDEVARLAHSLKSGCGNLGAGAMTAACARMEKAARAGESAKVDALLIELESLYRETRRAWEAQVQKRSRKAA